MLRKSCIGFVAILASASLTFSQNTNQAAVDTLTKDVARAVFGNLQLSPSNLKAAQIYTELSACGEGCNAITIIRNAGGYDAVGVKMEELGVLKNTARFTAMSSGDANAAIRKQLAQFYAKYKNDKNYGKPLNPTVQASILTKIDHLLPPNAASEPAPTASAAPPTSDTLAEEQTNISPVALQISQLERKVRDGQEKQFWIMIISALAGLLIGAGAVYVWLYRAARAEVKTLLAENKQLSYSLDVAKRTKPANEVRQPQGDLQQKATAYDAIRTELGASVDPLVAIRQLKQQVSNSTRDLASTVRSGVPEPGGSIAEPTPTPAPVPAQSAPVQPANTPRSEVFYFPPPDPNGQFDNEQKTSTLSPESAYRFSVTTSGRNEQAGQPVTATFRFEAEPGRVARFLTYRNYMIEPACESENSYFATHTRIVMRQDGEAVLTNGVWRVKKKALIRYE